MTVIRWSFLHALACAILLMFGGTARANTINVSFSGPDIATDANCSLTEALMGGVAECAPTGPAGPLVIQLPAGTRTWSVGSVPPLSIIADVTIRGAGASSTTLAANAFGVIPLFMIGAGAVVIEGITFEGWTGAGAFGGGVIRQNIDSELTVRDCVFRNNNASPRAGGAISAGDDSGTHTTKLTIERTKFVGNKGEYGGAVWAGGMSVSITDSSFQDNVATSAGGAAFILTTHAAEIGSVTGSTFTNNSAGLTPPEGNAAALALGGPGVLSAVGSEFNDNHAGGYGALWINGAASTVDHCTFRRNKATVASGGALVVDLGVELRDSTFIDNTALMGSGGAFVCQGAGIACKVDRTVFEKNVAGGAGGAILGVTSMLVVKDSIFVDNSAGLMTLSAAAPDGMATEGADTARFTIDRRMFGSAIVHQAAGTVRGSCFIGATGHIVVGPFDATGNFWMAADPTVRGTWGATTTGDLASPPAGCDPNRTPTTGSATFPLKSTGTATSGTDYTPLPSTVDFAPGVSTREIELTALTDSIKENTESVQLAVGDPNTEFYASANAIILDGVIGGAGGARGRRARRGRRGRAGPAGAPGPAGPPGPAGRGAGGAGAGGAGAPDGGAGAGGAAGAGGGESPDVRLTKSVNHATATTGTEVVFTLTITNDGPGSASNIQVTDTVPTGLTLLDIDADAPVGTTAACTLAPAQCTLSKLAAGATVTVTVRTRVIATGGEVRNVASATIANDVNPANNTDDAVVMISGTDGGATRSGHQGGCGCRTSGSQGPSLLALLVSCGLVLLARRRRR